MQITEERMEEEASAATGIDVKKKALGFIQRNRAASLATADARGIPHVAVVYCYADAELNVYFSTRVEGRKYRNLIGHPIVSMAFYNEESLSTIQLTGRAERVQDLRMEQKILFELITLRYKEAPTRSMPPIKLYERGLANELAVVKVVPSEMTYADFIKGPDDRYKPFFSPVI